jgi:predicted RNase H-like HicB family nuclease
MERGFGVDAVLRLIGSSYRQLDHWTRTGLVGSSIRGAAGRGSRRIYSFDDLVGLRVLARLRGAGVPLQTIRRALIYLKRHADRPLNKLALVPDGRRVLVLTDDPGKMIEASAQGQVVISLDLQPIRRDLQQTVAKLTAPREILVRVGNVSYRVLLTPDLEAGGFTVTVPELPGCITEADTIQEARSLVRDAITGWLDAAENASEGGRAAR